MLFQLHHSTMAYRSTGVVHHDSGSDCEYHDFAMVREDRTRNAVFQHRKLAHDYHHRSCLSRPETDAVLCLCRISESYRIQSCDCVYDWYTARRMGHVRI